MARLSDNPFTRYAYSPWDELTLYNNSDVLPPEHELTIFAGGDLSAYINNIPVGNLEAVTWSISVEVVGNFVMGRRDAVTYVTGRRVVVGSMVMTQYDRHALIEQVFKLSARAGNRIPTFGDLWETSAPAKQLASRARPQNITGSKQVNPNISFTAELVHGMDAVRSGLGMRGITLQEFQAQLRAQQESAARLMGATRLNYSDQIPPFDLTLVGVSGKTGAASSATIFGITITQETAGFSQNDLGGQVGMSFTALGVTPWRPVGSAGAMTGGSLNASPAR